MKIKFLWFCFVSSLLFILNSCGSNEESCDVNQIDQVMGMAFFDENGNPIGSWKTANDFTLVDTNTAFSVYPNPSSDQVAIRDELGIESYWIVPANCFPHCMQFDLEGNDITAEDIAVADLDEKQVMKSETSPMTTQLRLNLSGLERGLYKLFVRRNDGSVVWQNLLVYGTPVQIEDAFKWLTDKCG